ncbi:hypothetical protein MN608_06022 [Microdochium nivale]|nr:hypothetical protein MN608_06022 [Microdochium nivale]
MQRRKRTKCSRLGLSRKRGDDEMDLTKQVALRVHGNIEAKVELGINPRAFQRKSHYRCTYYSIADLAVYLFVRETLKMIMSASRCRTQIRTTGPLAWKR